MFSRLLAIAALAFAILVTGAPQASAQDPFSEFFGSIFGSPGGRSPQSHSPAQPRVRRIMPHQENRPPTYWRSGDASRAAKRAKRQEATPAESEKPDAAANYFVAVMGDAFGEQLGNGLEETFADKPEIGILKKARESSGLVRDDYYDWPKTARDLANGPQKIDVAVIMIGSNDRQSLRDGAKSEEPLSPRWREIYKARIDAMLAAFREKKIPVIWVGLPVMKNESFSADMAKLNDLFREEVSKDGGVYVDLWEALADEKGQFSAFGPDINGQIVKLRTADGVHLTEAGGLSVAHFVANEIKKLYEGARPAPDQQPTATAPATGAPSEAAAPAPNNGAPVVFRSPVNPLSSNAPALPDRPAIGPVQTLSGAGSAGGELARPAPKSASSGADAQALARHVFVEGGDQPARANRADDYSWKSPAPQTH
ncbi:MAG: SGNH/GDSL hydrolase family protein [Methylocystis sp.]|uniref:SGNH/GDSL hydrolase family protein n=1 Tax=Methylocystis sp. TaxID=1911079 RepID=UPI003DA411B9